MTKQPPGSRCAATLRKHATCAACVVRFMIVLKTRYATENVPSTVVVAKSPIVTPTSSPPGFARSLATIAFDSSIPWTGTPRCASGSATRPVPIPSSSARPLAGEFDEEVDDRIDGRRVEHLRRGLVVPRRDALVEVAVVVEHRRNLLEQCGHDDARGRL